MICILLVTHRAELQVTKQEAWKLECRKAYAYNVFRLSAFWLPSIRPQSINLIPLLYGPQRHTHLKNPGKGR